MATDPIPAVVACALACEELVNLRALQQLPEPAALLARLEARREDFALLTGVTSAYLHGQGVARV
jgi:hypothetical protein